LDGKFVAEIKQSFEEINGQIRKNIEVFQKQLTSSTNDRFEGFSKGLEYRFKTLSHAIAEQELKTLESSAKMWIEKDVPINAMREYFDMLAIAIKNESWMIEKCLEAISRILKKGFPATPELRPDANLIGNWSQILNSVHSKHSITVDAIKRQLQALRP
jgi:hypothetical protein